MINLKDLSFSQQDELFASLGEPSFRAKQIRDWIYKKRCRSIDGMTNLSKGLREELSREYCADGLALAAKKKSQDGTIKFLFELKDGQTIETVYIPEGKRGTVCVSTQVGCKFGCIFCATGLGGFSRNLTTAEILNQVVEAGADADAGPATHVVFMGMGEPLDNFENVVQSIEALNSPEGFGIGGRRITISTAGLIPGIDRLGELSLNINLAVSLHSADNSVRNKLLPINKKYPLQDLMEACARFPLRQGKKITMEVILFDGVNDAPSDAKMLVKALHGVKAKVNLLILNHVQGDRLTPSPKNRVAAFKECLERLRMPVTIRKSKGADIDAACGQLKSKGLE